jgi:hypothetical protein
VAVQELRLGEGEQVVFAFVPDPALLVLCLHDLKQGSHNEVLPHIILGVLAILWETIH